MLSVKILAKHGGRRALQIRNQTIGSAARLYSVTTQTSPYHNSRQLGVAQQTQPFRHGLGAASLLSGRASRIQARLMSIETEVLDSLGDSITTAVLVHWEKEPGDSVKEDDVIAVVETDKVTMDIRAKKSGVFTEALVDLQAEIAVGSPLYKLDTAVTEAPMHSETTPPPARAAPSSAPEVAAEETETVPVPVMGESITSGAVSEWTCKTGDSVAADQVVATIETDKVNVEVRSPKAGVIVKTYAEEGDEVNVGEPLFELQPGAVDKPAESAPASSSESSSPPPSKSKSTPAPPAKTESKAPPAPPSSSSSSGGGAKQADPAAAGKKGKGAAAAPGSLDPHAAPAKGVANRGETRVKMTRMRQRIAHRLKDSQNTAAMLTTFQEVDMGNLIELRKRHKDEFEKAHGVKLGFMSAFVRACTTALQETPAVNAVIDDNTQEIVYREYVDISVAVASPSGLVVPVLRNTENMNFAEVEKAIAEYGKKAKEGRLALEEMAGGTFTISNGGVFGSLYGMPIINPPQSAILGMHATKMRPVCLPDGSIVARPMMYLALTYDHRMIDGREAVTFLKSVANKIEDPHRLLLAL